MSLRSISVQFGCGLCAPLSWRNYDVSPALRFQRWPLIGRLAVGKYGAFPRNVLFGDIVAGLPLAEGSCRQVYSSHVLEHLSLVDLRSALANVFRILEPGGTFRFVMPDLHFLASSYLSMDGVDASIWFMRESYLGSETRIRGLKGLIRSWVGNSSHLWMWDYEGMSHQLQEFGFTEVRRASFGDSTTGDFSAVEDASRWRDALGIECRKPN